MLLPAIYGGHILNIAMACIPIDNLHAAALALFVVGLPPLHCIECQLDPEGRRAAGGNRLCMKCALHTALRAAR
jgi:hypothetical protein